MNAKKDLKTLSRGQLLRSEANNPETVTKVLEASADGLSVEAAYYDLPRIGHPNPDFAISDTNQMIDANGKSTRALQEWTEARESVAPGIVAAFLDEPFESDVPEVKRRDVFKISATDTEPEQLKALQAQGVTVQESALQSDVDKRIKNGKGNGNSKKTVSRSISRKKK